MSKTLTPVLVLLSLAMLPAAPAVAAGASLTVAFTNHGEPLEDPSLGRFYIFDEGKRERYRAWGTASRTARVEEGTYDVVIRYVNDTIVEERVLEAFEISGRVEHLEAFEITPAYLTIEITAGGSPIHRHAGSYDVHPAGRRGSPLASRRPGERLTLRSGLYDIEVFYRDPQGLQSSWLDGYRIVDDHLETVEIGVASARLRVSLKHRGIPISHRDGEWSVHRPRNPIPLGGGLSGDGVELAAGTYDIHATIRAAGGGSIERWVRDVQVNGRHHEAIELVETPQTALRVQIHRGGEALRDAWFSVYRAGTTISPLLTLRSGSSGNVPPGRYDIHCTYRAGSIRAERWLRDRVVDGLTEFNVDLPIRTASLTILPPRRVRDPLERANLLIVLDSSLETRGAMGSRSRLELTRRTIIDTIGLLAGKDVDVGLRVWGIAPRSQNNCQDSTLLLPLKPLNVRKFERTLSLIRPSGFSPIAYSLQEAARDLPRDERSTVVVITGGSESCSGDPCDAAARLIKRGRADRVHVVGLDQPRHRDAEFDCIGTYHAVGNRAQLRKALRAIFREVAGADRGRVTLFLPGRNHWVASAELGQSIQVQEGTYDLLIRVGGRNFHWNDFEIRGEMIETAGERR